MQQQYFKLIFFRLSWYFTVRYASHKKIKQGLTFASAIVFDTGFFLRQTDVVVVFTCVLVCDVIVVTQWRRLICFARDAHAYVCCFSRRLTYAIKWTRSAVAGMVICQDNKLRLGVRGNDTIYTLKLLPSDTLLTNITRICSGFKYCAFFNPVDTQG